MDTEKLANYLELLRYDRNIKQEDFIDGITSPRQYQRYRSGLCQIPISVISGFSKKLHIPIIDLFNQFEKQINKDNEEVSNFINFVFTGRYEEALVLYKQLDSRILLDEYLVKFLLMGHFMLEYKTDKISKSNFVSKIKSLVNFDNLMTMKILNDFESYLLGILMEYDNNNRKKILGKLYSVYMNYSDRYSKMGNYSELQLLFWICKNLGKEKEYEKVISLCDKAIEICTGNRNYYLLEYFYYYRYLSNMRVGTLVDDSDLTKCICLLQLKSESQRNKFYSIIVKDLDVDIREFIFKNLLL